MNGYVVVSHHRLNGWQVAHRTGSIAEHTRLRAPIAHPEEARSEAQGMFPGMHVYVVGDAHKPWVKS